MDFQASDSFAIGRRGGINLIGAVTNFAVRRYAGVDPVGDNVAAWRWDVIDSVRAVMAVLLKCAVARFQSRAPACCWEAQWHRSSRCGDKFATAVLVSVVTSIQARVTSLPLGGAVTSIQYFSVTAVLLEGAVARSQSVTAC